MFNQVLEVLQSIMNDAGGSGGVETVSPSHILSPPFQEHDFPASGGCRVDCGEACISPTNHNHFSLFPTERIL
ncbi:hypothetical protein GCM10027580_07230 [Corynebacterium faecale]